MNSNLYPAYHSVTVVIAPANSQQSLLLCERRSSCMNFSWVWTILSTPSELKYLAPNRYQALELCITWCLKISNNALSLLQEGQRLKRLLFRHIQITRNQGQPSKRKQPIMCKVIKKGGKQEKRSCTHCGRNNHTVEYCYHLVGFPEKRKSCLKARGKGPQAAHVDANSGAAGSSPVPGLSQEQFAKLVEIFGSNNEPSKAINSPIANRQKLG